MPRGSGGHHLTRPLTGGQPPLTGGPVVAGKPRSTTQVVTRGYLMINCRFRWRLRGAVHPRLSVRGWEYEVRDSRVLEADVARCDCCVAEALTAREANPNNRNENRNEAGNQNEVNGGVGGVTLVARACTYKDFLNCQPRNFGGTEGVVGLERWFEKMESVFRISNCASDSQGKFATCTLVDGTLTWWNSHVQTIGIDEAYGMPWKDLMKLMIEDAIKMANNLMDQKVRIYAARNAENKRKLENNPQDNHVQQLPFKRQNVARAYTAGKNEKRGYAGSFPYYNKCKMHHEGQCTMKCENCKKVGHMVRDCKAAVTAMTQRAPVLNQRTITFYQCGRQGHIRSECPKLKNHNCGNQTENNEACGGAYALGGGEVNPDSNVVTDVSYVIELADRRVVGYDTIIKGCTLNFLDHSFNIDLMPVELGSFYVIIGMDWLCKYHAVIIYDEKIVRIPYGNEMLTIQEDGSDGRSNSRLNIISCTKTQKYIKKGCHVFLAQITEKKTKDKSNEKRLEDVLIVRDFPEFFPEDFPGLPPTRKVEF
ncbi:putative reverse transcriptase domain-containing protein [Tanacetum coccineum]